MNFIFSKIVKIMFAHLKIIITFVSAISKVGFVYSLDLGIVNQVKLPETI